MNIQDMELDEKGIKISADIVSDHKTSKLVNVEVFVGEEGGISLVSTKKKAPKNVGPNGSGNVAQMVCAEGNTQKNNQMVQEESIGTS